MLKDAYFEIWIGIKRDLKMIDRKTGNILDLLSASGGLMRALYIMGFLLLSPYTTYVLRSHLAKTLVRYVPS